MAYGDYIWEVKAYYDGNLRGLADDFYTDDESEAYANAYEFVNRGFVVEITNTETGDSEVLDEEPFYENQNSNYVKNNRKKLGESVYLDDGEAVQFFATDELGYAQEWADLIRDKLGVDAYSEFVANFVDKAENEKLNRKETEKYYNTLNDKVISFKDFLKNDGGWEGLEVLDEETRGLLEEYQEVILDAVEDLGGVLEDNYGVELDY